MSNFLEKIEETLESYAQEFVPEGTITKALIHQWTNAISESHELFASKRGASKKVVLKLLEENNSGFKAANLFSSLEKIKHIKPEGSVKFKFIDLFAGIGGMRLGFQKNNGRCVFSSEFEKNAQETYYNNYGEYPFGDITKININDIPSHDVLAAGFPCQPFSNAGQKMGIEDTRGTLFYNIAKILESKKPKFALLENVKGLISHDQGKTLHIILKTLTGIGYRCNIPQKIIDSNDNQEIQKSAKKMILKSVDFGVPQNRQRIYIVLWKKDLIKAFKYPEKENLKTRVGDILEKNPLHKFTISDKLWLGHQRRRKNNKLNGKGFGYNLVDSESAYTNTISARYYKDGSEILISQGEKNPRKLTPREAARLQGFPENFLICKSEVNAYKQFGNSVTVPVIEKIAREISNLLR